MGSRPARQRRFTAVHSFPSWPVPRENDRTAEHAAISVRTLQRLFDEYVGVPPKWVVRRFRVQEAAERAREGGRVDWAALAVDLGYTDQPHFVHDFKAQVGRTPSEYAAWCADSGRRPGDR